MVGPPTTQSALAATPRSEASTRVAALGTILGVWAHPDDEAYLSAAVMRLALENGQRVACVTATAGERGTADPASCPPEKLGTVRRRELQASFAALQSGLGYIIEHEWLGYRDEHCADAAGEAAEIDLNLVLDEALWTVKDSALRAHATQTQPVFEHLGPELWRAFSIVESFRSHSIRTPTGRERRL